MSATETNPAVTKYANALHQAAQRLIAAIDAINDLNTPGTPVDLTASEKIDARNQRVHLFAEHDAAEKNLQAVLKKIEKECAV